MTDTEVLIRECLTSYADDAELTDLVGAAKARGRQLSRRRAANAAATSERRAPRRHRRGRLMLAGAVAVVLALVATAFVLGGHRSPTQTAALAPYRGVSAPSGAGGNGANSAKVPGAGGFQKAPRHAAARPPVYGDDSQAGTPATASGVVAGAPQSDNAATIPSTGTGVTTSVTGGVTATRVVKTGDLSLTVPRGHVQATVIELVNLTTGLGGYVSQSRTDDVLGAPHGALTLRMPVGKFDDTLSGAAKLGHETSLSTDAHDVTGKFVDLSARLTALRHTRSTYLTILGKATTIGSTLAVQQRVDDVQSQIEQLQGELKVLRNQSADGTLTVDVSQAGSPTPVRHRPSHGIGKAWHNSVSRFSRGTDSIVGALGPLLLGLLVLAFLAIVARFGWRGIRRLAPNS